ncbi:receptor protein kinase ZmPK1 [Canna indica]|uniref:Receptor-like serine/threonine-protein kinase n=1 Tax=Canna indica TaxID=4628 RepID=A0AAQ3KNS3_9LILI|nr:receptor protein kinase ZmPK1 [Canna indica]
MSSFNDYFAHQKRFFLFFLTFSHSQFLRVKLHQTTPTMRNPPHYCTIVSLFLLISSFFPSFSAIDYIARGSSLSVEEHATSFLVSEHDSFACGFYEVGDNAFAFAIWFKNSADRTVAWVANRDRPVNGRGSRISLHKDGALVLTDFDGTVVWSSGTSFGGSVDQVKLFNTGNLAVVDSVSNLLWQSFDSPTNTLLAYQLITKKTPLVSSSSRGSVSSGFYRLYFDNDNVLRLIYDGPEISSIYWPNPFNKVWDNGRSTYNSSRLGSFNKMGHFYSTDKLKFNASDYGQGITRRLTLDYDGNLRLYSLNKEDNGSWSVSWQAIQNSCEIHGTCGRNALCVHEAMFEYCSCLPGFDVIDPSDLSKGCRPKYNFSCKPNENHFLEIPLADFWGFDLAFNAPISFTECKEICEQRCTCQAFVYREEPAECYPKNILFNGRSSSNSNTTAYLKLPKSVPLSQFSAAPSAQPLICDDTKVEQTTPEFYQKTGGKTKWEYFYGFVSALFVIEALFIACGWWFIFRREQMPTATEEGYKMISSQFRRYTYAELRKATRSFKDVVGRGGSGTVYKGVFDDDREMAVKKLEDVIHGEEEFKAELSLIGRIYHKNLVRIFGYCSEGSHKLLISEYIKKGSLDKYLFDSGTSATLLGWRERFKIAVGVAKGLAYLHHECLEWVIHCDVKPENILLDMDFEPRIADFGLVKLLNRGGGGGGGGGSNLSRIRGTRGYIAPEWASSLPINGKVDVYSYGVVLLELVKGERVSNWVMDGAEEVGLVLRRSIVALKEKMESGEEGWIDEFVDHRLDTELNWKQAMLMLQIALSCLEEDRNKRPTMDSVVQMLLLGDD